MAFDFSSKTRSRAAALLLALYALASPVAEACRTTSAYCTDGSPAAAVEGDYFCADSVCPGATESCPQNVQTLRCPDGVSTGTDNGNGILYCYGPQCVASTANMNATTASSTGTSTNTGTTAAISSATTTAAQIPIHFSTAMQVSTAAETAFQKEASRIAEDSTGAQQASLVEAAELRRLGSNRAATIGAIFCAEGANKALSDPELSGADFASCRDQFAAANALKNGGLEPDGSVSGSAGAMATFTDLEKNFGVTRDDYLSRMLGAGGSRDALSDLLSSRLSAEKLSAAFAAADAIPPRNGDGEKFAVDLGGGRAKKDTALRNSLKAKLADSAGAGAKSDKNASSRRPAGNGAFAGSLPDGNKLRGLQPLHDGIFAGNEDRKELTLFDVVHLKYEEIRKTRGF